MIEISGAISGATFTLQALKAAIAARDEVKIDAAISDLKDRLFDAQTANLHVVEQLHQAQARVHAMVEERDQFRAQLDETGLYVLHNLAKGPAQFWAYRYESDGTADNEPVGPPHYLCQPCKDIAQKKSVLRLSNGRASCGVCRSTYQYAPPRTDHFGQPID